MDYIANPLSDMDRELAALERDLERFTALQDMTSYADRDEWNTALSLSDIAAIQKTHAGIESFETRLNTLINKVTAIDEIAAGIESFGKISLRDVAKLEAIAPGIIHDRTDATFTLNPSTQGLDAGLEAIDWSRVGRIALIAYITLFIINIIRAVIHINSVKLANERIRAFNEAQRQRQRAHQDSQQSWQRANSSSGGGSYFNDDWFKDFDFRQNRNAGSSGSSGGGSYNHSRTGSQAGGKSWENAKKASQNTNGDVDKKARANEALMDEFEKLTARLLRNNTIGFSSSMVYTTGKWTIEYVIRNRVQYHDIVGPEGYFDYKETFFYSPDAAIANGIGGRIRELGTFVKQALPTFTPALDKLVKTEQRINDTFKQLQLLIGGTVSASSLEPMIKRIDDVVRETTMASESIKSLFIASKVYAGDNFATKASALIEDIHPTDQDKRLGLRKSREKVYEIKVSPEVISKLFSEMDNEITILQTIESTMDKLHKSARQHSATDKADISSVINAEIQKLSGIDQDTKQTIGRSVRELSHERRNVANTVFNAYKIYQQEIAQFAKVINRAQEALKIVTAQLKHEEMFEKQIKKVYDMANAAATA